MEKVTGSFGKDTASNQHFRANLPPLGHDTGLSPEDAETLSSILPGAVLFDSEFTFYIHASAIFRSNGLTQQETSFIRLALSVAPPDVDTSELWFSLIRGYIDLGYYEDAYSAIIATPYDSVYVSRLNLRYSLTITAGNGSAFPSWFIGCVRRALSNN
jgi:nuclear pore complex protein Nup160